MRSTRFFGGLALGMLLMLLGVGDLMLADPVDAAQSWGPRARTFQARGIASAQWDSVVWSNVDTAAQSTDNWKRAVQTGARQDTSAGYDIAWLKASTVYIKKELIRNTTNDAQKDTLYLELSPDGQTYHRWLPTPVWTDGGSATMDTVISIFSQAASSSVKGRLIEGSISARFTLGSSHSNGDSSRIIVIWPRIFELR